MTDLRERARTSIATREQHSAAQIHDEVARLLNANRPFPITVPLPVRVPRHADNLSSNWDMPPEFRSYAGFQIEIGLALLSLKQRWDLVEGEDDNEAGPV
jgi:hypothetical protein